MPVRRHCDPVNIKRIWDAIRFSSASHQVADINRITRYMQKFEKNTQVQADLYITQALKDKLIIINRRSTGDGTSQSYKIIDRELPEFDGKDWYCFECHLAGEVTACANCFRVFHSDCLTSARRKFEAQRKNISERHDSSIISASNDQTISLLSDSEDIPTDDFNISKNGANEIDSSTTANDKSMVNYVYEESLCSICNIINIDHDYGLDKTEMNYLLKFLLHRIRAWLPNTITHTMAQEDRPEWLTDSELTWRANQLFFEHRDMSVIEVNLNNESYNSLSEFLADILTVQHNVAIFHGIESQEYEAAELMVKDTIHDIQELKNCPDCYKHSNEKINPKWFCLPCRVPHNLVWAKQKGYPYWPAKVMKETSSHFDVRFFGGKYERAVLVKALVKPITMTKESLQIKTSAYFNKAYEELKYHQTLLTDPLEVEKVMSLLKPKRKTFLKQKNPVSSNEQKTGTSKNNTSTSSVNSQSDESVLAKNSGKRKSNVEPNSDKKKKPVEDEKNSNSSISGNIIDISDGDDEEYMEYSFRENNGSQEPFSFDETFEQVTSSTENYKNRSSPTLDSGMQQLDQPYSDSVEKMRRKLEGLANKKEIIKCAMDCMQAEVDKMTNDHNDHLKRLFESHNAQISETKKKQWCYNCEQDAIYHCCWNTAYCSQTCQQQHWQAEHKKVCRRKR